MNEAVPVRVDVELSDTVIAGRVTATRIERAARFAADDFKHPFGVCSPQAAGVVDEIDDPLRSRAALLPGLRVWFGRGPPRAFHGH